MECPMPQPNDLRLLACEARRLASSADTLSIVLAGHRKLKNDLCRPSIEEISSRATIFELDGSGREQRKFFVASLAEVAQEVQRAALHHRAQLWQGLVR
jgi:type II secretory pathway predicted ATPase ExeA